MVPRKPKNPSSPGGRGMMNATVLPEGHRYIDEISFISPAEEKRRSTPDKDGMYDWMAQTLSRALEGNDKVRRIK